MNIIIFILAVIIRQTISQPQQLNKNEPLNFKFGDLHQVLAYTNDKQQDLEFNLNIDPNNIEGFNDMCFLLFVSGGKPLKKEDFVYDIIVVDSPFYRYANRDEVKIISIDLEGFSSAKKSLTLKLKKQTLQKYEKLYFYVLGPYKFGAKSVMKSQNQPIFFKGTYSLNNKSSCQLSCNDKNQQGHCEYQDQQAYCQCNVGYIDRDCGLKAKQIKIGENDVIVAVQEQQQSYLYFDISEDNYEEDTSLIIDVQFNSKTEGIIFEQKVNITSQSYIPDYDLWLYARGIVDSSGEISFENRKYVLNMNQKNRGSRIVLMVLAEDDTQLQISIYKFQEESADSSMFILYIILGVLGFIVILYIIYIAQRTKRLRRENRQLGQNILQLQASNQQRARQQQQQKLTIEQIDEYMPSLLYSTHHKSTLNNDQCAVCLEDFQIDKDQIRNTICQHVFHSDCLGEWLKKQQNCPFCRQELTLEKLKQYKENPQAYIQVHTLKVKPVIADPSINPQDPQQEVLNNEGQKNNQQNQDNNIQIEVVNGQNQGVHQGQPVQNQQNNQN